MTFINQLYISDDVNGISKEDLMNSEIKFRFFQAHALG